MPLLACRQAGAASEPQDDKVHPWGHKRDNFVQE